MTMRICGAMIVAMAAAIAQGEAGEHQSAQPRLAAGQGELKIEGQSIEKLTLEARSGLYDEKMETKEILQPGPSVRLPAGKYRLCGIGLRGGFAWGARSQEESPYFTLAAGQTYTVQAGPPLKPELKVARNGRVLEINYRLLDAAGRDYLANDRTNPPKFAIYQGEQLVGSGTIDYG